MSLDCGFSESGLLANHYKRQLWRPLGCISVALICATLFTYFLARPRINSDPCLLGLVAGMMNLTLTEFCTAAPALPHPLAHDGLFCWAPPSLGCNRCVPHASFVSIHLSTHDFGRLTCAGSCLKRSALNHSRRIGLPLVLEMMLTPSR